MLRWSTDNQRANGGVPGPPQAASPAAPEHTTLEDLLLEEGAVTEAQLERALKKQQESGAFLGEILAEEGILDEKSLLSFLTKHCRVPHLSLLDYLIDKKIAGLVPRELCLRHRVLPLDQLGRNLTVAMVNPLDREALAALQQCCPDLRIKPILCACNHFEIVIRRIFGDAQKDGPAVLSATSLGLKPAAKPPAAPAPESKATPIAAETTPESAAPPSEATQDAPRKSESTAVLDGDSLIQRVFRAHHGAQTEAPAPPPEKKKDSPTTIIMREMASAMMDSMRDTYAMLARRITLFREIDPENVARIFARGNSREFESGVTIFRQGDPGDVMYIVLSGRVRIADGERELAVLEQGDMFGEMALVSREPRSATASALERVGLLALGLDDLKRDLPREVALQLLVNILVTLSERLRRANAP